MRNRIGKGSGSHLKIRLDAFVMAVLFILCCFLPFAKYTYRNVTYTINGVAFLTGTRIMGGAVTVATVIWILLGILLAVIAGALAISALAAKRKWAGRCLFAAQAGMLVLLLLFRIQLEDILEGVKKPALAYGFYVELILCIFMLAGSAYSMYRNKTLTALDFFVLPGCIYLLINNYIPMAGMVLAFKKLDFRVGLLKSAWVGLDNFQYLFQTNDAWVMTRNTILYNLVFIVLNTVLGIGVSICLNEIAGRMKKAYQTAILLPQMISIIIIAYIVYAFLGNETGLVNHLLGEGNEIEFYQTTVWWPFILTFVHLWKGLGYNSIIYLSGIVGIDQSLYEAAVIDGATKWKQIRHITIPLLKPVTVTLVLISVGRIFYSDFGLFYQVPMDSGSLFRVTQTIDTYVYRALMQNNNIAMASAASVYQSVVGFILVLLANLLVNKLDSDNALF